MGEAIPVDEARRRVLAAVCEPEPEPVPVPLERALGRVLAEDVVAAIDVPPFDGSAMDGFAVVAGAGGRLTVVGESRAGHPAPATVGEGTAIRISTGASIPAGADAVVRQEDAEETAAGVLVPATEPGANVRAAGEDVRAGQAVLRAGTVLEPVELGVAASVGRAELQCARRPRVALVMTGDELTAPGEELAEGRIYGSNLPVLAGAVERAGGEPVAAIRAGDEPAETRRALERALRSADVVCASGGVSVGPHDHVRAALLELGAEERFHGVALRPGRPTWFGVHGRTLVFGLPGNPVSAAVTFQLFVRPALLALQGAEPGPRRAGATLAEGVERNPRRAQAVRVRLSAGERGFEATPTGPQGSHRLTSLLEADALALIGPGRGTVEAGEQVEVELL
jgi:molybdopterin molybdotransferase